MWYEFNSFCCSGETETVNRCVQNGTEVVAGPVGQEPTALLGPGEGEVVLSGAGRGGFVWRWGGLLQNSHRADTPDWPRALHCRHAPAVYENRCCRSRRCKKIMSMTKSFLKSNPVQVEPAISYRSWLSVWFLSSLVNHYQTSFL